MELSVIIPVYNEVNSIREIIHRVQAIQLAEEILVVDDGSADGTRELLGALDGVGGVRVLLHEKNLGKGAAVRTGLAAARGNVLIIQDADLEYDPKEIPLPSETHSRRDCGCGLWVAIPGWSAPPDLVLEYDREQDPHLYDQHPL